MGKYVTIEYDKIVSATLIHNGVIESERLNNFHSLKGKNIFSGGWKRRKSNFCLTGFMKNLQFWNSISQSKVYKMFGGGEFPQKSVSIS